MMALYLALRVIFVFLYLGNAFSMLSSCSYRKQKSRSSSCLFASPSFITHYEELSVPTLNGISLVDITKGKLSDGIMSLMHVKD
jgi:hypothetical protein